MDTRRAGAVEAEGVPADVQRLRAFGDRLNQVCLAFGMVFIVTLLISSALQVLTRYVLNASLTWTEEAARYSFIWATMLGAACLSHDRGHAVVDFLSAKLQGVARWTHAMIVLLLTLAASGLVTYYGFNILAPVSGQTTAGLGLSMSWVYAAMPVGFGLICLHAAIDLYSTLRGQPPRQPTGVETERT